MTCTDMPSRANWVHTDCLWRRLAFRLWDINPVTRDWGCCYYCLFCASWVCQHLVVVGHPDVSSCSHFLNKRLYHHSTQQQTMLCDVLQAKDLPFLVMAVLLSILVRTLISCILKDLVSYWDKVIKAEREKEERRGWPQLFVVLLHWNLKYRLDQQVKDVLANAHHLLGVTNWPYNMISMSIPVDFGLMKDDIWCFSAVLSIIAAINSEVLLCSMLYEPGVC